MPMFVHFLTMLAPLTALLEIACAFDGRALREFVPLFEERGAREGPDEAERSVPIRLNREAMVEPDDESVEEPHLSFRVSRVRPESMRRACAAPVGPFGDVVATLANLSQQLRPFCAKGSEEVCRLQRVGSLVANQRQRRAVTRLMETLHPLHPGFAMTGWE